MRSIGAKTRMTPGPFSLGSSLPNRKMTPRSYSARILIDPRKYSTTTSANSMSGWNGMFSPRDSAGVTLRSFPRGIDSGAIDRPPDYVWGLPAHAQCQPLDPADENLVALGDRFLGRGRPDLSMRRHPAGRARGDRAQRPPQLANHPRGPGGRPPPLGSQPELNQQDQDGRQPAHDGQDH